MNQLSNDELQKYFSVEKGGYVRYCSTYNNNPKCIGELVYIDYYAFRDSLTVNRFCLSCAVKQLHDKRKLEPTVIFNKIRNCPNCGDEIKYKNKGSYTIAIKLNKNCTKCNKKKLLHECLNPYDNPNCRHLTGNQYCVSCASYKRTKTPEEIQRMLATKRATGNYGVETRRKNGTLKHTEQGKLNISNGLKLMHQSGVYVNWNKGETVKTNPSVARQGKSRPGKENPMSGRSYYDIWVNKYGKEAADRMNHACAKNKSHSYESYLSIYHDVSIATQKYEEYLKNKCNIGIHGYSKISQTLFNIIKDKLQLYGHNKMYYATNNHEWVIANKERCVFLDFYLYENKKAIEFHGDVFHANPLLFHANDTPHPYHNIIAEQIWQDDANRLEFIKNSKYVDDILVVWEYDFNHNRDDVINKCINFLIN